MKTKRSPEPEHPLDGKMEQIQERAILRALVKSEGNRTKAARRLGVAVRTIQMWINKAPGLKRAFPKKANQYDEFVPEGIIERSGQRSFINKNKGVK